MNDQVDLCTLRESQTIELKEASDSLPINMYETYSSFANTRGGTMYLGIKEKKPKNIITGVTNEPMLKKSFFSAINNKTKVSVALVDDSQWQVMSVEGKTVIAIAVREAPISLKPVYLNGNPALCYLRKDDGDYPASPFERRAMELDAAPQKFDMRPNAAGYEFGDLNRDTLSKYRSIFNARNPDNLLIGDSDEDFFLHIGALKKNGNGKIVPTNAAVLLFGNYLMIKEIFPEYNLDYRENKTGASRWDYRLEASSLTWTGNAFDFYHMVVNRIQPMLPNRFHLNGLYEDGGEGLLECVREGLTNAIANCDYMLPGGVQLTFSGGVLTFKNAGKLRLPIIQVLQGGESDPRNEGVMNLLHLARIGDKAGEGVPNIYRRMRALGFPDPILEQSSAPSRTTLVFLLTQNLITNSPDLETKIIHTLAELGEASVTELAKTLSVNNATVSLALKEMCASGTVENNGKATKGKKFWLKK